MDDDFLDQLSLVYLLSQSSFVVVVCHCWYLDRSQMEQQQEPPADFDQEEVECPGQIEEHQLAAPLKMGKTVEVDESFQD